jgi:hypothetical protein
MKIAQREVHDYFTGQDFYEFERSDKIEYHILLVEGFVGDLMHTFVYDEDYELFNNGIRWLNGDRPEEPPVSLGLDRTTFTVSYLYEETPDTGMSYSIHPFVKEDGSYIAILHALASEMIRLLRVRDGIVRGRDVRRSNGKDLEYLGSWFNIGRFSGETDEELRGRVLEFLNSYISSGTIDSVSAAIEAYTGVVPEITELWQSVSYFDYNQDDYDNQLAPDQWRTYLFEGGSPDNIYTFQAYFYDELFQLNTFFCILPEETIREFGVDNIKIVLEASKAAGVQAYLGWLIDENFADTSLSDWTVIAP